MGWRRNGIGRPRSTPRICATCTRDLDWIYFNSTLFHRGDSKDVWVWLSPIKQSNLLCKSVTCTFVLLWMLARTVLCCMHRGPGMDIVERLTIHGHWFESQDQRPYSLPKESSIPCIGLPCKPWHWILRSCIYLKCHIHMQLGLHEFKLSAPNMYCTRCTSVFLVPANLMSFHSTAPVTCVSSSWWNWSMTSCSSRWCVSMISWCSPCSFDLMMCLHGMIS